MVFQLIRWMIDQEGQPQSIGLVPHTAFYNTDRAHLILGDQSTISVRNFQDIPKYIQLRAQLKSKVRHETSPITLTYIEHEHNYETVALYPPGSLQDWSHESVDLHYLGIGDYSDIYPSEMSYPFKGNDLPWGNLSLPTTLLYSHKFRTQGTSLVLSQRKDVQEVRGYGGYWRLGCSLEQIQQVFFTAGFEGEDSSFYLSTLADWREKNADPSQAKRQDQLQVEFIDCDHGPFKNLQEAIFSGGARLQLVSKEALDQGEKVYEYRSVDVIPMGQDQLQIVYMKGE